MLPQSHRQEAICRAYVRVVAAQAGVTCGELVQDYGVDMYLRGIERVEQIYLDTGPQIDLQLKSSTTAEVRAEGVFFDLDVRAYNLLRRRSAQRPCLLVVLVLPEEESHWFDQSAEELTLRRCAYWCSLRGDAPTNNQSSIRIQIPLSQVFSPDAVRAMMNVLSGGTGL